MSETFATPGPVHLDVRVPAGEIVLDAAETSETTVELQPLRDNDASREAIASAQIEMRERAAGGQDVRVIVEDRGGFLWFGRGAEVLVRVRAPQGTNVEIETASADVRASGRWGEASIRVASSDVEFDEIDGRAEVASASGDVTLRRVSGDAQVNTASGDVEIDDLGGGARINTASGDVVVRRAGGPLEVNSASGDVIVGDARAGVRVHSASGDQRVDSLSEGEVTLESASGDIRVRVRRESKLWVDATSRSGEVSSDFPIAESPPAADDGPLVELRARSGSGDIHVARV